MIAVSTPSGGLLTDSFASWAVARPNHATYGTFCCWSCRCVGSEDEG